MDGYFKVAGGIGRSAPFTLCQHVNFLGMMVDFTEL